MWACLWQCSVFWFKNRAFVSSGGATSEESASDLNLYCSFILKCPECDLKSYVGGWQVNEGADIKYSDVKVQENTIGATNRAKRRKRDATVIRSVHQQAELVDGSGPRVQRSAKGTKTRQRKGWRGGRTGCHRGVGTVKGRITIAVLQLSKDSVVSLHKKLRGFKKLSD